MEPLTRINEIRKRIKQELRELEERKEELHRRKEALKAYMNYLEELRSEVGKISSEAQLTAIIRKGELKTQIRPAFFKLSKYLIEQEIKQKLENAKEMLEECLQGIKDINWKQRSAYICPNCHGQRQLREVQYVRGDGLVHPILRVTTCPVCNGKGTIDYQKDDEE